MFILSEMISKIRVLPQFFQQQRTVSVGNAIREKYIGKLLPNIGICVGLHDILAMGESAIHPGDGGAYVKTKFRLVVFRPFDGEIITGKILACSSRGIQGLIQPDCRSH